MPSLAATRVTCFDGVYWKKKKIEKDTRQLQSYDTRHLMCRTTIVGRNSEGGQPSIEKNIHAGRDQLQLINDSQEQGWTKEMDDKPWKKGEGTLSVLPDNFSSELSLNPPSILVPPQCIYINIYTCTRARVRAYTYT